MHGDGTMTWPDGNKYVGEYKNGKRDGNGTYTAANGDRYVGEYTNDKKHGQGTDTNANGTIKHSGEWENGYPIVSLFIFLSYINYLLSSFSYNFHIYL